MHRDRLLVAKRLREIVALEHARDRVLRRELDHAGRAQRLAPLRVVADLGLVAPEHEPRLSVVGLRVGLDLLARQRRPRRVAARRVADHRREVADEEDHLCPRSCIWRILFRTTVWPRWMSGAVGSRPSLMRSGVPVRPIARAFARLGLDQQLVGAALDQCQRAFDFRPYRVIFALGLHRRFSSGHVASGPASRLYSRRQRKAHRSRALFCTGKFFGRCHCRFYPNDLHFLQTTTRLGFRSGVTKMETVGPGQA